MRSQFLKFYFFIFISLLLAANSFAVDCASPVNVSAKPSDYFTQLGGYTIAHGASLSAALGIIKSRVFLSSAQLANDTPTFTDTNFSPLKNIFFQIIYDREYVSNYLSTLSQFDVLFLMNPLMLDRYSFYAVNGWNYDRYSNCVSEDTSLKNGALFSTFDHYQKMQDKKNEVLILSPTGVSLRFLSGIVASRKALPKVKKALKEMGLSADEIEKLTDQNSLRRELLPINELTTNAVHQIYLTRKGSRIFWEDLTGDQPFLETSTSMEKLSGMSAAEITQAFLGREILVQGIGFHRLHLRVSDVVHEDNDYRIEAINIETGRPIQNHFLSMYFKIGFVYSQLPSTQCQSLL